MKIVTSTKSCRRSLANFTALAVLVCICLGLTPLLVRATNFPFNTVADMQATAASLTTGDTATVSGYDAVNDGGGGTFTYNSTATTTVNTYSVFAVNSHPAAGRWTRNWPTATSTSFLHVKMFGVKGGKGQSAAVREANTRAIQKAIDETLSQDHPILKFGGDFFELNRLTDGDNLDGSGNSSPDSTMIRPTGTPGAAGFNRAFIFYSFILQLGHGATSGRSITLLGDGATLYTEEEQYSPVILLCDATFASLTIEGINFDRKVTLTRYERVDPGYPTGVDFYGHTSSGLNRGGVRILPVESQANADVNFKNVTFAECHPAIQVDEATRQQTEDFDGVSSMQIADFRSKLDLMVESCRFVYPHGANVALEYPGHEVNAGHPGPIAGGGGVGLLFVTDFVGQANITDNFFDGAVGGDLSTEPSVADTGTAPAFLASAHFPVDGFPNGQAQSYIFERNRLQNFGAEACYCSTRKSLSPVPTATVDNNDIDGAPVITRYVNSRPNLFFGITGIVTNCYQATITNNRMLNINCAIAVSENGINSIPGGPGTAAGSVIENNWIRTYNSDIYMSPEDGNFQSNVMAIQVFGDGDVDILNNLVNLPVSRARIDNGAVNAGIVLWNDSGLSGCTVANNVIWADGYGTGRGLSIGIMLNNGVSGNTIQNNVISNFGHDVYGWPSSSLGSNTVTGNSLTSTAHPEYGSFSGYTPLSLSSPTVAHPDYSFGTDANGDTGLFLAGQNSIGFAAGGSNLMTIGTGGVMIHGPITIDGTITNNGLSAIQSWILAPTLDSGVDFIAGPSAGDVMTPTTDPLRGGFRYMADGTYGRNWMLTGDVFTSASEPADVALVVGTSASANPSLPRIYHDSVNNRTTIGHNAATRPAGTATLNVEGDLNIPGGPHSADGGFARGTRTIVLSTATTNATQTETTTDGATAGAGNRYIIPNNTMVGITATIMGIQDTGVGKYFVKMASFKNLGGTLSQVGTTNDINTRFDSGATNWAASFATDATTKGLKVQVTGETSKNIEWVCRLEVTELTLPAP